MAAAGEISPAAVCLEICGWISPASGFTKPATEISIGQEGGAPVAQFDVPSGADPTGYNNQFADFNWTADWDDPWRTMDWFHNMKNVKNAGIAERALQQDVDLAIAHPVRPGGIDAAPRPVASPQPA